MTAAAAAGPQPLESEPSQPEDSRTRILAAAAEIAAESGYEGTTISRVTKRSGLPVSSVYWFFKDKDDLLAEVVRHSFDEWFARQPDLSPPDGGALGANLKALLGRSVRSLPDAPDFLRIGHLLTLEGRPEEPAARKLFLQIRATVEAGLAQWFAVQLPAAVLDRRPELPVSLARLVIAATDGLFLAYQIEDFWDPDEFVALIVAVVESAVADAAASS